MTVTITVTKSNSKRNSDNNNKSNIDSDNYSDSNSANDSDSSLHHWLFFCNRMNLDFICYTIKQLLCHTDQFRYAQPEVTPQTGSGAHMEMKVSRAITTNAGNRYYSALSHWVHDLP